MDEIRSEFDQPDIDCCSLTLTEQRSLIFHLLYALEAFDYETTLESITDSFERGYGIIIPKESDVFIKTSSIVNERDSLDQAIIPLIENWRLDRLGVPTKLILRMAIWELKHTDTDPVVIINEAIELAQSFAEKDAFKFINGVLDKYVKETKLAHEGE